MYYYWTISVHQGKRLCLLNSKLLYTQNKPLFTLALYLLAVYHHLVVLYQRLLDLIYLLIASFSIIIRSCRLHYYIRHTESTSLRNNRNKYITITYMILLACPESSSG